VRIPYHAAMQIGDDELLTLKQAAERIGVSHKTLQLQAKSGALKARLMGNTYLVTAADVAAYDERRKQARGFARPDHPLHGKQGPGHRRKKADE
jgi:excisionase family DNA binding protein